MKKSVELFAESLWGEGNVMTIPVNTIDKPRGTINRSHKVGLMV